MPHPKYHWLCHPQFTALASRALINLSQAERLFCFSTPTITSDAILLSLPRLQHLFQVGNHSLKCVFTDLWDVQKQRVQMWNTTPRKFPSPWRSWPTDDRQNMRLSSPNSRQRVRIMLWRMWVKPKNSPKTRVLRWCYLSESSVTVLHIITFFLTEIYISVLAAIYVQGQRLDIWLSISSQWSVQIKRNSLD